MTDSDFQRRFGGIARLYGEAGLARFVDSRICVIGIGGVGSWVAEALVRSAVGAITLFDLDHVAESNTNRQLPALDGNYGRAKVAVMRERMLGINPACRVEAVEVFVEAENLQLVSDAGFDYVVDCIDNFRTKAALIAVCRRKKVPLVTVGGAGGQVDPTRIRLVDLSRTEQDPLLAKTRKLLRREYGFSLNTKRRFGVAAVYSDEPQCYPDGSGGVCASKPGAGDSSLNCGGFGSAVTVTASFGLVAASHVLNRLAAAD